jgi:L-aminopeptidase/D-esterase-like protein
VPSHTEVDGDVAFAVAIHEAPEERIALHRRLRLTMAVELAVERAVLDAARSDASNVTS